MIGIGELRPELETRCGMVMADACYLNEYDRLVPYDSRYEAMARSLKDSDLPPVPTLRGMEHNARKEGDLETANTLCKVLFVREYPFKRETIRDWFETMLLAKNWDDAHYLLFCLYEFNAAVNRLRVAKGYSIRDYRRWDCPTPDTNVVPSDLPGFLREVLGRSCSTRAEAESSIRSCGWSDYWNTHFVLSQSEYNSFVSVFGSSS